MKKFYLIILLTLGFTCYSSAQISDAGHKKYCTYTQAFYGSYTGETCSGVHAFEFIESLLEEDLVIGGGFNTLTITQDETACLIGRLPGHGPSAELNGMASCSNPTGIELLRGYFNNSLLSQTITLGLNLRADEFLGDLRLEDRKLKTWKAKDCSDASLGKKGRSTSYYLSQDVLNYLEENNSVSDLYTLANAALAGEEVGILELWQITSAITVINHGFSGGRFLKGFYSCHKDSQVDFGDQEMFTMKVYPNPMKINGTIEFTTLETGHTSVELYNVMGELLDIYMNEYTETFTPIRIDMAVEKYTKGMYILYIRNGSNVYKEKIMIVK